MKKNSLLIFSILTTVFCIVCSVIYYKTYNNIILSILMLTPMISVILSKLITKENFRDLGLVPKFKKNYKWYLFAYFSTPFIAYFGAILYFFIYPQSFDMLGSQFAIQGNIINTNEYISQLMILIPAAIIINPLTGLITCFGEELAWRCYLLPKLIERFNIKSAVILSGLLWGLWHAPIVYMGYNYGSENTVLGVLSMLVFCIVIGVILAYLFLKTKSVWTTTIFHASLNGIALYTASMLFMSKPANPFVGPDLTGVIGGSGFIILSILLFSKLKNLKYKTNK